MRDPLDALRSLKKYVAACLPGDWEIRLAYEEGAYQRPFCRVGQAGPVVETGSARDVEYVQPYSVVCHPVERDTPDEALLEAQRVLTTLERAFRWGGGAQPPVPELAIAGEAGALPAGAYSWAVTAVARKAESAPVRVEMTLAATGGAMLSWEKAEGARAYRIYRSAVAGSELLVAETALLEYHDAGGELLGAVVRDAGRGTLGQPRRVPLWAWDGVAATATSTLREEPDYLTVRDLSGEVIADPNDDLRLAVALTLRLAWRDQAPPSDAATLDELRIDYDLPVRVP